MKQRSAQLMSLVVLAIVTVGGCSRADSPVAIPTSDSANIQLYERAFDEGKAAATPGNKPFVVGGNFINSTDYEVSEVTINFYLKFGDKNLFQKTLVIHNFESRNLDMFGPILPRQRAQFHEPIEVPENIDGKYDSYRMDVVSAKGYLNASDYHNPWHWFSAIARGNSAPLLKAMASDKSLAVLAEPVSRSSTVHVAAQTGNLEVLKAAVAAGASLRARNVGGSEPIHLASSEDNVEIVRYLLDAGVNPSEELNTQTPLHFALGGNAMRVAKLLIERGADVNAVTSKHVSALHYGVLYGSADIVQFMIDKGADVNIIDSNGKTPLQYQCHYGRMDIIDILLKSGAKTNLVDNKGETPLDIAAQAGWSDVVDRLLHAGAKIDVRGPAGFSPLHYAASGKDAGCIEVLLAAGAKVNDTPSPANRFTPIAQAAKSGNLPGCIYLYRHGGDPAIRDAAGKTALDYANEYENTTVAAFLSHPKDPKWDQYVDGYE